MTVKILAKKVKMTQTWNDGDVVIPVTVLQYLGENIADVGIKSGDYVYVSGVSKGKGFQGVVKRHGFGGGPSTHGQKNRQRAPGSIGATAPQRVIKGKKMAGHMGAQRVTVKNLLVARVDEKSNVIFVRGGVPGMRGTVVEIRKPS